MEQITLIPYNEIYYKLECSKSQMVALRNFFSLRAPGFIFNPLYKNGLWNGFICLFKGDLFPKGLVEDLRVYCQKNNVQLNEPRITELKSISDSRIDEIFEETQLSDVNKKSGEVFPIKLMLLRRLLLKSINL